MTTPQARKFALDRVGVAMIAGMGLVLTPLLLGAAIWRLTHGFAFEQATPVDWVFTGLSVLLGALIMRITARELRWGAGVRIDEGGVGSGSFTLGWDEVETLEAPRYGILDIGGAGKQMSLRTYLFQDRRELLEYIARRTGKPVPERMTSR